MIIYDLSGIINTCVKVATTANVKAIFKVCVIYPY
jgi:hypothetical protein